MALIICLILCFRKRGNPQNSDTDERPDKPLSPTPSDIVRLNEIRKYQTMLNVMGGPDSLYNVHSRVIGGAQPPQFQQQTMQATFHKPPESSILVVPNRMSIPPPVIVPPPPMAPPISPFPTTVVQVDPIGPPQLVATTVTKPTTTMTQSNMYFGDRPQLVD